MNTSGIYKITNLITQQSYIGQSINLSHRLSEHRRCEGASYIHNAIKKYGLENFSFEVIEYCDQQLLNEREQYWVAYYDSYNNGYNMTIGGDAMANHPIQAVVQYDLQGNQLQTFKSVMDASRQCNIASGKICAVCKGNRRTAGGYQWRYPQDPAPGVAKLKTRAVDQFDLNGNFIQTWESATEAGKFYHKNMSAISHVCQGVRPTAWGYKWKYHDEVERSETARLADKLDG